MNRFLLIVASMLIAMGQISAKRSWVPPTQTSSHEAVVYAALKDASGNVIVPSQDATVTLGAFIDGVCRATATPYYSENTPQGNGVFTLRIGVEAADANKTVQFALKCNDSEYTFSQTVTVSGGDETIGGVPSSPLSLPFIPVTEISVPRIDVNVGGTVNLLQKIVVTPSNATLPDTFGYDFANSGSYFTVNENGILTGLVANTSALWLGLGLTTPSGRVFGSATVYVNQPITGITLSDPNVSEITVDVNDDKTLMAKLKQIITITPKDATEPVNWVVDDTEAFRVAVDERGAQYFTPVKVGSYKFIAKCANPDVNKVVVVVNVIKPITDIVANFPNGIPIRQNDNVSQYFTYLFEVVPADATEGKSEIKYSVSGTSNEGENIFAEEGGVFYARNLGLGEITITHSRLNKQIVIPVFVIKDVPDKDSSVLPTLSFQVSQSEIGTLDVTDRLKAHLEENAPAWDWYEFKWHAAHNEILEGTEGGERFIAAGYGHTSISGNTTITACGFDDRGNFNAELARDGGYMFDVIIAQELTSISINDIIIGCEDANYEVTINTVPENIILKDVTFTIPVYGENQSPLFRLDRIEGTNTWKLNANSVGGGILYVTADGINTKAHVRITQHITLGEGWKWVSLYSGTVGLTLDGAYNVQEVRSQTALTYNDPKFGFFGTLGLLDGTSSYKFCVKEGQKYDYIVNDTVLYQRKLRTVAIQPGWNWVNNLYCKNHTFNEIFAKVLDLPEDSRIVSQTGFMTLNNYQWQGTLESFNAGEGYLIYNAGTEAKMIELIPEQYLKVFTTQSATIEEAQPMSVKANMPELTYNPSKFADNMTIIAKLSQTANAERYEIVPFVGNECRGESKVVNGRYFITVHGENKENISFKLFDKITGELMSLDTNIPFSMMAGSMSKPLTIQSSISGVEGIGSENFDISVEGNNIIVNGAENVKVFTVNGVQVTTENLIPGVYIVKAETANGIVNRKVYVKGY